MSRRYHMAARADAAAETRRRIVETAMAVQAEQGAAASWEAIARGAGVSTATVYRHFRSLDELVPACMERIWTREQLDPTPREARRIFDGLESRGDRFERLIRASCHCYAKAPGWLAVARAERDGHPALQEAIARQQGAVRRLVDAALDGAPVGTQLKRTLRALVDVPFWQSLVDTGMPSGAATDVVVRLVRAELSSGGIA